MSTLSELENRIAIIEARNKKVELDKNWETSVMRRISLMLLTYFITFLYFRMIKAEPAYLNAIVPTLGFLLSSLTLSLLKKVWTQYQK